MQAGRDVERPAGTAGRIRMERSGAGSRCSPVQGGRRHNGPKTRDPSRAPGCYAPGGGESSEPFPVSDGQPGVPPRAGSSSCKTGRGMPPACKLRSRMPSPAPPPGRVQPFRRTDDGSSRSLAEGETLAGRATSPAGWIRGSRSGRERGWRPQGESNPRRRRERAVSWASRRWGRIPVRRPGAASFGTGRRRSGGARRDRTADLYNAIVALSRLSYGPVRPRILVRCREPRNAREREAQSWRLATHPHRFAG